jgi:hypothetical protein
LYCKGFFKKSALFFPKLFFPTADISIREPLLKLRFYGVPGRKVMEFGRCRNILLQEITLVRQIACLQELIKDAVISRNWVDFENHFSVLGEIGDELTVLETGREALFDLDQLGDETQAGDENNNRGRFYAFAARFPDEQRNELTAVYRNLKLETLKAQMAGTTLMGFISGARAAMTGFFEIAFPERGGKIYTPHGRPLSHDMRSMVLNRTF